MMFRPSNYFALGPPRSTNTIMPSSYPAPPSPVTTISLDSNKSTDRRTITIRPGEDLIIGRASRSEFKNLQSSPDNALYECPVVSRVHAVLRASVDNKTIHITDRTSLHGTTVNGHRLNPGMPFELSQGDVIKLGERVTRGEDTHDGVSVTYNRLGNNSLSTFRSTSPARVFSVPSPSDIDVSDMDSDSESLHSDHHDHSSAQTTPEQPKHQPIMGSQQAPIDLDSFPMSRPIVVDLPDDDEDELMIVPESESHEVPDVSSPQESDSEDDGESAYYNTGLSQNLNEQEAETSDQELDYPDEFEEGADDESVDDADNLSDSAASDLSNAELGDEDLANVRPPFFETHQLPGGNPYQQPARYDPVRNSQPPAEESSKTTTDFREPYKAPTSTYTYGLFGYGSVLPAATDFPTSSRWDIPPPRRAPPFPTDNMAMNPFPPVFPSYGTDPNFGRAAMPAPPPPPPAQPLGMNSMYPPPPLPNEAFQPRVTPAAKGKITIPDIVEEGPKEMLEKAREMVGTELPSPTIGLKRKATETEETTQDSAPEAKKQKSTPAPVAPQGRLIHRRRSANGRGTVRRIAEYAASAVVGGVGVIAFLNSDLSQSLIDWLA